MNDVNRLWSDPALGRFDPLPRILCHDDFNRGLQGYTALVGNYEDTLDTVLPGYRDMNQPMLSNGTHWETGSHGGYGGTYALKIATRARAGAINMALKRLTFRKSCPIRLEAFLTFKPEATELQLSELDVRAFTLVFDIQDKGCRWMPHVRYLNALNGVSQKKWQFKCKTEQAPQIGNSGKTKSHHHFSADGWQDIPNGGQEICYNEVATKYNWHYFRIDVDLAARKITGLQFNDNILDTSAIQVMKFDNAWPNLAQLFNICWLVETDTNKRAFLYLDSVLLSGDFDHA